MAELKKKKRAKSINLYDREQDLIKICSALSDPSRRKIIKVINECGPMTINDISWKTGLPVSTASYHVKALIDAELLIYSTNSNRRGNEKYVALGTFLINMSLAGEEQAYENDKIVSINVPIGSYTNFEIVPPCGIFTPSGTELLSDTPVAFYSPNRFEAGIIWMHAGFLEYSIPLTDYIGGEEKGVQYFSKKAISSISFKFELCSEAPLYNHDFKSDITFTVNGTKICTFTSSGDFGDHRGKLNPEWLPNQSSQYGIMYNIDVRFDGSYLNEKRVSDIGIDDLGIVENDLLTFRIAVDNNATHVGGFNIYGKTFGDYPQDISVDITYLANRLKK